MMPPRIAWRHVLIGVGCAVSAVILLWAAGFAWFIVRTNQHATLPQHADGIVAFTGGAERVETALQLLAEHRADRLLLSGIGGGAELAQFAHRAGLAPAPLADRVTLGRQAATTRGNALETSAWAEANSIHTLIVVTAYYHMPRALTELRRALPDVSLYPLPVLAEDRPGHGVPLRLMAEEYTKLLAAEVGLTRIVSVHENAPPHGDRAG
jgi:uncharacterized SAM-binding protein YcdF (DUF218 family)